MYAVLFALLATVHPLHTSAAELVVDRRAIVVTLRVFADDFAGEVGKSPSDAVVAEWVDGGFELRDGPHRRLQLQLVGREPVADMVHLTLLGPAPRDPSGLRVHHTLFFSKHADQVNVVRVRRGRKTATLLFTHGDGPALIR